MSRGYVRSHIRFQGVSLYFRKRGVCPVCGKVANRKKKIWKTINPFYNKNRDQLSKEIGAEGKAWKAEPTYHLRCEP